MKSSLRILQSLTTFCLLAWWISFTFYSSVVVPIGTELFDAMHQGLITQQVTQMLNILTGVYLLAHLVEFFVLPSRRIQKILWALIALALSLLVYLHGLMEPMVDVTEMDITNGREFYRAHRLYLWVNTIGWGAGGGVIYLRLFARQTHSASNS